MKYLSKEWIKTADTALSVLDPLPVPLLIAFAVASGPQGDVQYQLKLGPDRVGMIEGSPGETNESPDVQLGLDWAKAVAISQGQESVQQAFLDGDLTISGRPEAMLGHQKKLNAVEDVLAPLRSTTDYA